MQQSHSHRRNSHEAVARYTAILMNNEMNTRPIVAVLGAGSWGTALAILLARYRYTVRLWGHHLDHLERLSADRENRRYLPGISFPTNLEVQSDLSRTLADVQVVLVAVPSSAYRETLYSLHPHLPPTVILASATKGLESGCLLHEVIADLLGTQQPFAALSGPNFAREIAIGLPAAMTVAAFNLQDAQYVATLLHGPTLRAYSSTDVIGVELGGAFKNVLAIAAGIADGLGFGANARAALITRGLAEMVRLGEAIGGRRETFMGLSGVGDLVLTCTDDQSRNRRFGMALGRGQSAQHALMEIGQVVEGLATVREIQQIGQRYQVELPITEQVAQVLYRHQNPRQAVELLLAREPKVEL